MAASATSSFSTMMECSLCLSRFKKPKSLPCLHTYCLECLEEYVDRNNSPYELPCPLCREMFTIPAQGVSSLRDNFLLLNMIESERSNKTKYGSANKKEKILCDLCKEEQQESSCPVAQKYCTECDQNMCSSCLSAHGKMRGTRSHVLVILGGNAGSETAPTFNRPRFCDKHKNDSLRIYCITCEVPVCMICCAVEHQGHQCEEINDTATNFRRQFQRQISQLGECFTVFSTMIQKLKSTEANTQKESKENESSIREKCNEIRRALDLYEADLLGESKRHAKDILTEITSQMSEVECLNKELGNVQEYLEKMIQIGSPSDVACNGKQLIDRAERLMKTSKDSTLKQGASVKHVKFIPYTGNIFDKSKIGLIVTGERILLTLGLHTTGPSTEQKICEISLEKRDTIKVINSTPAEIWAESAACVVSNVLYAVGIGGGAYNQLWAWSASRDEWTRCADMTSGRRRHCVTSVGDKIYVLGGWVDTDEKTLDSILCYDINSNKWSEAGQLCHAVHSATCVTYKQHVYVFGGTDKDNKNVNHVQVYDTTTRTVSLASNPMPAAYSLMKAVLWRSEALLIDSYTCYIYDFESSTWQERKRFKTDVIYFGLTLDGNTLYITGGGMSSAAGVWTCRADVKSLLVDDFLSDNKEAEWKHHATLPAPALIHSHSNTPLYK